MTVNGYIKALKKGQEVVCVSNDKAYSSTIFYMGTDNTIYSFSRYFGIIKRFDLTLKEIAEHIKNLEADCQVFVRGFDD